MASSDASVTEPTMDPVQLLVMANRIDGIAREMTNTMIRTARSSTLAVRDLSTSISTADHQLFTAPEGVPAHVYGSGLLCRAMAALHPDFKEGDAFLHNDPYLGNTHAADHTILVPVFYEGEHVFTMCAKAHLADCGNAIPTTYTPRAIDVYAEGALIFPCVLIQRGYEDVGDIVRMCRKRIRAPEIWYGDYLSMLAAARVGEQRIQDFCRKFGLETVKAFVREWLDYSERLADAAIRRLPAGRVHTRTALDPFPGLPDGLPLQATIDVDSADGRVTVDFRDNPDCTRTGLNLSEATAMNCSISGVLAVLNSQRHAKQTLVFNNAGSFRRIQVLLRENCAVGVPRHPASCSMATTTIADRALAMVYGAFGKLADGIGLGRAVLGLAAFPRGRVRLRPPPRRVLDRATLQRHGGGACQRRVRRLAHLSSPQRRRPQLHRRERGHRAEVPLRGLGNQGSFGLRRPGPPTWGARQHLHLRPARGRDGGPLFARRYDQRSPRCPRRRPGSGTGGAADRPRQRNARPAGDRW